MKYPINLTNKPFEQDQEYHGHWYIMIICKNSLKMWFHSGLIEKKTCQSSPVLFDEIQHNKIITIQCHILQSTTVTKITWNASLSRVG